MCTLQFFLFVSSIFFNPFKSSYTHARRQACVRAWVLMCVLSCVYAFVFYNKGEPLHITRTFNRVCLQRHVTSPSVNASITRCIRATWSCSARRSPPKRQIWPSPISFPGNHTFLHAQTRAHAHTRARTHATRYIFPYKNYVHNFTILQYESRAAHTAECHFGLRSADGCGVAACTRGCACFNRSDVPDHVFVTAGDVDGTPKCAKISSRANACKCTCNMRLCICMRMIICICMCMCVRYKLLLFSSNVIFQAPPEINSVLISTPASPDTLPLPDSSPLLSSQRSSIDQILNAGWYACMCANAKCHVNKY